MPFFLRICILSLLALTLLGLTAHNPAIYPIPYTAQSQSGDRALFFAVNTYDHLNNLSKPIQNAREIAAELEKTYGFIPEIIENPSIDKIDQTIETYRQGYANGTYPAGGQLFIYFSGHGLQEGRNGYFMAKDSDPERPQRTGMEYDYYRNQIDQINCKHILVAIDACHSATFDPMFATRTSRSFQRKGEEVFDRILANHESYKARVFWTSDAVGKETPDRSNFAYHFLEGLRSHQSSTGYLRSSELFSSYVEKATPKPGGGRFGSDQASACFLFFAESPTRKSDQQAFIEAIECNTASCLEGFIEQYPDSRYLSNVRALLAQLRSADLPHIPKMVRIPGGSFEMGSKEGEEDEKPTHQVTVSSFYMAETEVTVEQFEAFILATGYETDAEKQGDSRVYKDGKWKTQSGVYWKHDAEGELRQSSKYNHPVIHISWNDAAAYCDWLSKETGQSYRLPSEAQWEYAAGNGRQHTKYSWGNGNPSGKNGGNVADESKSPAGSIWSSKFEGYKDGYFFDAPVKQYAPNDFGLYDMTGNVWEWCRDWFDADYYTSNPTKEPQGPESGTYRVLRGGSWNNDPENLRVADRALYYPGYRDLSIGFRPARIQ